MYIRLEIKCTPLTHYWLTRELGEQAKLSRYHKWGRYLLNELSRTTSYHKQSAEYPESFFVLVQEQQARRLGHTFSIDAQRSINNMVRNEVFDLFYRNMCFLHEIPLGEKVKIKTAINQFRDIYGFSEDVLPYETLKKDYYRKRIKAKTLKISDKKFLPKLSPKLS